MQSSSSVDLSSDTSSSELESERATTFLCLTKNTTNSATGATF